MAKMMDETTSEQRVEAPESGELSEQELEKVTGGATNMVSNIMKMKHDTVKNTISNIH
ncbi:hypothetical protein GRAN_1994 [Granulicella sibirica]|uniref:Uncharacterized protein n=1 Tax=Granulicella sibirica TaxID=2479048 RepID=A0A4V1L6B5_9BACT|nr:hypothetical protein GRAN_1994 [Granulicella sibirica]